MDAPDTTLTADGLARRERVRTGAALVLAHECERPHAGSVRLRLEEGTTVSLGRGAARSAVATGGELAIRVPDPWMSSDHARIEWWGGRWILADDSKNGSIVDGVSVARTVLEHGSLVELGRTLFLFFEFLPLEPDLPAVREVLPAAFTASLDPAWESEQARLFRIGSTSVPVLLVGEPGTGKHALARALHEHSGRGGPLVTLACAGLGEHEAEEGLRGGRGGTVILENVGALPLAAQARLLAVLEGHEGGVIAMAEQELDEQVAAGAFRADLLAWIARARTIVPQLAERRADLGLLVAALHERLFPAGHPGFELGAMRAMLRYAWPGNVRELEEALVAARALAGDAMVHVAHLPEAVRATPRAGIAPPVVLDEEDKELYDRLRAALRDHRGNISAVARELGKDRVQIHRWMKRFGLDFDRFR